MNIHDDYYNGELTILRLDVKAAWVEEFTDFTVMRW